MFINNKSDNAYILSKATSGEQATVIINNYLLRGQPQLNKIEINFFKTAKRTGMEVLYYDYNQNATDGIKARIISENEYDSLPVTANSLAINIEGDGFDFASVPSNIWRYVLFRANEYSPETKMYIIWPEIQFNPISWDLYDHLGPDFFNHQSDYIAESCPQTLYIKSTENGEIDVVQVTITTKKDIDVIKNFLERNRKNIRRLAIINMCSTIEASNALQSLPSPQTFENIEFFAFIDAAHENIQYFLYHSRTQEIVTSSYLLALSFLDSSKSIQFAKFEFSANDESLTAPHVVGFMRKYAQNIALFHIYMDNKERFLEWGIQILENSSGNVILEHNLFDSPEESFYCRVLQVEEEYMAIEFRGKYDWFKLVRTGLKNYRFFNGVSRLHGKETEWASRIMECTEAQSLLINDETSVLPNALITAVETECDLGNLNQIEMHIPNKGNLDKFQNCTNLRKIIFNFYKEKRPWRYMIEIPLFKIIFPDWDIQKKLSKDNSVTGVILSKAGKEDGLQSSNVSSLHLKYP